VRWFAVGDVEDDFNLFRAAITNECGSGRLEARGVKQHNDLSGLALS
jgi:hypothetical protein